MVLYTIVYTMVKLLIYQWKKRSMASPNALKGGIVRIQRGLAIYQVNASPYWYARIRDPSTKRHVVRSTKENVTTFSP